MMKKLFFRIFTAIILVVLITIPVFSQENISLLRVMYNTAKTQNPPADELKPLITEIDQKIQTALESENYPLAVYLLRKGYFVVRGGDWTPEKALEFSINLRSEKFFADSEDKLKVTVEQTVLPDPEFPGSINGKLKVGKSLRGTRQLDFLDVSKTFMKPTSFIDDPFEPVFGFPENSTGIHTFVLEITDSSGEIIAEKRLNFNLLKGLNEQVDRLKRGLEDAENKWTGSRSDLIELLPTIRMPLEILDNSPAFSRQIVLSRKLEETISNIDEINLGIDPFKGKTGDIHRAYILTETNEILPYRLYLPTTYDKGSPNPLIVALHGLGGTESSFILRYGGKLVELAEEHGYIVACPLGYRRDGGYGMTYGSRPKKYDGKSEKDVLNVLEIVQRDYNIDPDRIYLTGHSMGAIGTWYLAAEHPGIFAAIAPFAGYGIPRTLEKFKHIPQIVVHGDEDPTVTVRGSRAMVNAAKEMGIDVTYIEVAGGDHMNIVEPNLRKAVEFFNKHKRKPIEK
ncbi:MAG: prolyl oligopeptidase family serine peptidase [bacterium]|nr:prolyl oligopeptidase family serine peptidase [bacterium]